MRRHKLKLFGVPVNDGKCGKHRHLADILTNYNVWRVTGRGIKITVATNMLLEKVIGLIYHQRYLHL